METIEEVEYEGLQNASCPSLSICVDVRWQADLDSSRYAVGVNMMAGALAGISEHAVMFPVDSIKASPEVNESELSANAPYTIRLECKSIQRRQLPSILV